MNRLLLTVGSVLLLLAGLVAGADGSSAAASSLRPTITGMSAHSSGLSGGQTITVYGRHLRSSRRVSVASGKATFHVVTDDRLRVRIPRSARAAVTHVYVSTSHGTTAASSHDQWTYFGPPTVSGLSSTSGPLAGGTRVTVTGRDLRSVRAVSFGSTAAHIVSRTSPTTVVVVAPRHGEGAVRIWVTTPYGTARAARSFTYAAAPTVSSPNSFVSQAGGAVSIDGTNLQLVRTVTVDGKPARVQSAPGSSLVVAAPSHTPGLVPVVITTAGGTVTTRLLYESTQLAQVTSARDIDIHHGQIVGLSCPSSTFCMAVDDADAAVFDGTGWSRPVPTGRHGLQQVSCPSANFCAAYGSDGAAVYDGSHWAVSDPGLDEPLTISCGAEGHCVAIGTGRSFAVLDGGVWRTGAGGPLWWDGGISCVGPTFCMVVGSKFADVFDGTAWTETAVGGPDGTEPNSLSGVSCLSDTECSAIDLNGSVWRYEHGAWTYSRSLPRNDDGWRELSCGSPGFCVTSDGITTAVTSAAGSDQQDVTFDRPYDVYDLPRLRVSCASATFCMATSLWGAFSEWNGARWSAPAALVNPVGRLTSVACTSSSSCFAGDDDGTVVPYDGSSWGEPVRVDPWRIGRVIVSCAASGLCATVSVDGDHPGDRSDGATAVLQGGSWHPELDVLPQAVSVSCGGTTCLAVSATQYSMFDAGSAAWSVPAPLPAAGAPPGGSVVSISCAGTNDCELTFGSGHSHFDGRGWSAVARVSEQVGTGKVGCGVEGSCLVRNSGFSVLRAGDGTWGSPVRTAADSTGGDVAEACSGPTCLSLSRAGFQVFSHGTWTVEQDIPAQIFYLMGVGCAPDGTCVLARSDGTIYHVTPSSGG